MRRAFILLPDFILRLRSPVVTVILVVVNDYQPLSRIQSIKLLFMSDS